MWHLLPIRHCLFIRWLHVFMIYGHIPPWNCSATLYICFLDVCYVPDYIPCTLLLLGPAIICTHDYCLLYGSLLYADTAFYIIMDVIFLVTHLLWYGATSHCLALWISTYVGFLVIMNGITMCAFTWNVIMVYYYLHVFYWLLPVPELLCISIISIHALLFRRYRCRESFLQVTGLLLRVPICQGRWGCFMLIWCWFFWIIWWCSSAGWLCRTLADVLPMISWTMSSMLPDDVLRWCFYSDDVMMMFLSFFAVPPDDGSCRRGDDLMCVYQSSFCWRTSTLPIMDFSTLPAPWPLELDKLFVS